ncbi:MAG: sensor histidine kinase [Actinomycetota bacterium]
MRPFHVLAGRQIGAVALVTLGVSVLTGWVLDIPHLKSVNTSWASMKPNTAVCFILLGSALAVSKERTRQILGATVVVIASVTLLQYLFEVNLGIDDPFGLVDGGTTEFAARMAPNAAIAFGALGIAAAWPSSSRLKHAAQGSSASLAVALSLVPLIGYLTGDISATGWGSLTKMAVHTAMGLALASGTFALQAWSRTATKGRTIGLLQLPLVTGVFLIFVTVWFASVAGTPAEDSNTGSGVVLLLASATAVAISTAVVHARAANITRLDVEAIRNALQHSLDGVVHLDGRGTIVWADPAFWSYFSAGGEDRLERHWTEVIPDDQRPPISDAVALAPRQGRAEVTVDLGFPGARTVRIVIVVHPLGADQGQYWAFQDVTEQHKAARELARSNEELGRFASVVSHDLKEPLRMVSGYIQLLASRYSGELDETADEFIAYTVEGTQRMHRLIEDLLAYARAGTGAAKTEEVQLSRIVEEAIDALKPSLDDSGAEVHVDALPTLEVRSAMLRQVFTNLLTNAIKYAGTRPPRIQISSRRDADRWIIAVRDHGIGIPEHQRERIFEPFERLHRRDQIEGTGVGLAICARVVEQHGGKIWVQPPREGSGSVFVMSLPDTSNRPTEVPAVSTDVGAFSRQAQGAASARWS